MSEPVKRASVRSPSSKVKKTRTVTEILREPSTWAGILSIGAAFATGGASALADPATLSSIGAGLALILTKEGT